MKFLPLLLVSVAVTVSIGLTSTTAVVAKGPPPSSGEERCHTQSFKGCVACSMRKGYSEADAKAYCKKG